MRKTAHAALLLLAGCGGVMEANPERDPSPTNPDAGTGGAGTGGAGTGGAATGGAATDGAPPGDGRTTPPCEASTGGLSDAATVDPADARDASSLADAGDPPAHCIAPCIWDLMKNCRPAGACTSQDYGTFPFLAGVSCAPGNDWWEIRSGHFYSGPQTDTAYYLADSICYSVEQISMRTATLRMWHDSAGRAVAMTAGFNTSSVICGPLYQHGVSSPADYPDIFVDGGGLAPGFTEYAQDPTSPDCAPWQRICEPGCCGEPPVLPEGPY